MSKETNKEIEQKENAQNVLEMTPEEKSAQAKKLPENVMMLGEMVEEMQSSINNIALIRGQQAMLIEIIKDSKKVDAFEDFIKNVDEQCKQYQSQSDKLGFRVLQLRKVLEACTKSEDVAKTVSQLLEGLGVFKK